MQVDGDWYTGNLNPLTALAGTVRGSEGGERTWGNVRRPNHTIPQREAQVSISQQIAAGVAEGVTAFLKNRGEAAQEAIETLEQIHGGLHLAAGELSTHIADRPAIERAAIPRVMEMTDPVTLKNYTKTGAEANLDLDPVFAEWRRKRNELEGQVHFLERQADVQRRVCDLQIALLQIVAKES